MTSYLVSVTEKTTAKCYLFVKCNGFFNFYAYCYCPRHIVCIHFMSFNCLPASSAGLPMKVFKHLVKYSFAERGFLDTKQTLFWGLWSAKINTYQAFTSNHWKGEFKEVFVLANCKICMSRSVI